MRVVKMILLYSSLCCLRRSLAFSLPPIMRAPPHLVQTNFRFLWAEWGISLILILHFRQYITAPSRKF